LIEPIETPIPHLASKGSATDLAREDVKGTAYAIINERKFVLIRASSRSLRGVGKPGTDNPHQNGELIQRREDSLLVQSIHCASSDLKIWMVRRRLDIIFCKTPSVAPKKKGLNPSTHRSSISLRRSMQLHVQVPLGEQARAIESHASIPTMSLSTTSRQAQAAVSFL